MFQLEHKLLTALANTDSRGLVRQLQVLCLYRVSRLLQLKNVDE